MLTTGTYTGQASSGGSNEHSDVNPDHRNNLTVLVVSIVCLVALSRKTLHNWWYTYTAPESYFAHAPLIPIMVAFMLWSHRERIGRIVKQPCWPAAGFLVVGAALQVFAAGRDMEAIMSYSLIMMIWSGVWFILGTAFVRSEWFPLFFLALMIPLPGPVLNDMTHGLQQISTAGSSSLLNHIGFENWRTGYLIQMSNYTLFVDVPCSGFKTLLALLTFDAFFAFMLDGSVKKRLCLFAATAPLAIAINVTRITGIAIVGECISESAAAIFHDWSGLITVLLGFAVLFVAARLFGCRKFAGLTIF